MSCFKKWICIIIDSNQVNTDNTLYISVVKALTSRIEFWETVNIVNIVLFW